MSEVKEPIYDLKQLQGMTFEDNRDDDDILVDDDVLNNVVVGDEPDIETKQEDDTEQDELETEEPETEEQKEDENADVVVEKKPVKKKFKRDKRIEGLIKSNSELKKQIDELLEMNKTRQKKENESELSKLEKLKKEAFEEGDYEKFQQLQSEKNVIAVPEYDIPNNDVEGYFKSHNPWYGVDRLKTAVAKDEHAKIINDPKYQHLSVKKQLDMVSDIVKNMPEFKQNPYQSQQPVEGVTRERPNTVKATVSRADVEFVRTMFPNLDEKQLIKQTQKFVKNINNKNRGI